MAKKHYLMIDIAGLSLSVDDKILIQHPLVGGVILFERNYDSLLQLRALTAEIHALGNNDFIIGIDHEGGRVQRLRKDFTLLSPMKELGDLYDITPGLAIEKTELIGKIFGKELKNAGIDYVFGPVLDINAGISTIIGDRSFHADPKIISILAATLLQGIQAAELKAVGKHFPGHGHVKEDSHIAVPIDPRSFEEIASQDLLPFQFLINTRIDGIMPAHVIYEKCDNVPAGFSSFWLQKILRHQLNFQGLIFSDDLSMTGASPMGNIIERTEKAFAAGCDIVLICNNRPSVLEVINAFKDKI